MKQILDGVATHPAVSQLGSEALGWHTGLDLKPNEGRPFYSIVAVATIGGVALCFMPIDPMKALFYSAVINGVIAVPIMVVMMLLATRESVMGAYTIGKRLRWLGWLAVAVVALFVTA